jgi:hypothetical protein
MSRRRISDAMPVGFLNMGKASNGRGHDGRLSPEAVIRVQCRFHERFSSSFSSPF